MTQARIHVSWSTASNVGRRRIENQDAVYPVGSGEGLPPVVLAVADGLGGMPGGALAARTAIDAVAAHASQGNTAGELIDAAVGAVQRTIRNLREREPELEMMSTTLTIARIRSDRNMSIAHVGDSRLYVYSAGAIEQVTDDHTVAMQQVRDGTLKIEDAPEHRGWDVLNNWVGADTTWMDNLTIRLRPGERVLVCSDGLTNMVTDDEIAAILAAHPDDATCVETLVDAANEAGGHDNITVALATIRTDDPAPARES